MVEEDSVVQQILIDLRTMETLKWDTYVLFHDDSISKEAVTDVVGKLRKTASLTIFDLTQITDLRKMLSRMPMKQLGNKCLFMVSKRMVPTILTEVNIYNGSMLIRLSLIHI